MEPTGVTVPNVNFVGHIAAASTSNQWSAPGFRVGVVAPDLCASAGVALGRPSGALADGISHHRLIDARFHDLPWFRGSVQALSIDLQEAGVRRGPARAAAHVGCELIIDGELLHDPAVDRALAETWAVLREHGPEVSGVVADRDRATWRHWLSRFVAAVEPRRYAEPEVVAFATSRILSRRPRLAVDSSEQPALAATLEAHAARIRTGAAPALAEVSDPPSSPARLE